MQGQLPILIFAQSARFIAESATLAGYTVWVADCYGDTDTQQVASRFQLLPPLTHLSVAELLAALDNLSAGEPCHLVCGTGIEQFYPLLQQLPEHIQLLGNPFSALTQCCQPDAFFPLLTRLAIPYPAITKTAGAQTLTKNLQTSGGMGINRSAPMAGDFFQRYVDGIAASVCFIANAETAQILSINQQFCEPGSFRLAQLITPLDLDNQQIQQLADIIDKLTRHIGLRGLNSLDFMIDRDDAIQVLEINPRISASAELLGQQHVLFKWHKQACDGELPTSISSSRHVRQLSFLFSQTLVTIAAEAQWPEACHDIPAAGTLIETGAPICTFVVEAQTRQDCEQRYQACVQQVQKNLITAA